MSDRAREWINAMWPVLVGLVLVVASYVTLQGKVTAADEKATAAQKSATDTDREVRGVREALIDLKRTVEERMPPRPR